MKKFSTVELVRRAISAEYFNIYQACKKEITEHVQPDSSSRLARFRPQYFLNAIIGGKVWSSAGLFPFDIKKKGKRRIYTSRVQNPSDKDIFIYYLSKKMLDGLMSRSPEITDVQKKYSEETLSERWIIVNKYHHFRDIYQLYRHLLLVEKSVSKSNKPLVSVGKTEVWRLGFDVARDLPARPDLKSCLHFDEIKFQKFTDIL